MSHFDKPLYDLMEKLSKTRLSKNFIMRDFLHCNENSVAGICNYPEDVEQVIQSGKALCEKLLEPIYEKFGKFHITYGYQNRLGMELQSKDLQDNPKKSSPHHWDRFTHGKNLYCRVDIWPVCVEDGEVSKEDFARWIMMNLDVDLLMGWRRANIFCITYSEFQPRRVWLEWVPMGEGDGGGNKIEHMGRDYWGNHYPSLPPDQRSRFHPSATNGRMSWGNKIV